MGIVAFGNQSKQLENLLPFKVYPLDFVHDEHQLVNIYNAVDIYVTPSLQDNLPNTIMEAMACGIPCVGFNVGAMYDVTSRLSVGASFRSKMQMKVRSGDATVSYANEIARAVLEKDLGIINAANFKASMPSPYVLTLGASYRPVDKLTLAFDAQLTGWKTYKELHIDFLSDKLSAYDQKLPKRYCNAWAFRLGGEYALTPRLDLRAGMMVDLTPVNKEHFNPETPGMTRLGPSAGLTFRPLPRLGIDVSFMYVAGLGRKDASCTYPDLLAASMPVLGLPAEQTFRADYHVHAFIPSIGIRYAF